MSTTVRSPQDFLNELKTMSTNPPAIPAVAQPEPSLTLGEIKAEIERYRLALDARKCGRSDAGGRDARRGRGSTRRSDSASNLF